MELLLIGILRVVVLLQWLRLTLLGLLQWLRLTLLGLVQVLVFDVLQRSSCLVRA
jgi:hypothetical protein